MPGLLQFQADHPPPASASNNVEDRVLWLPSRIPAGDRAKICATGLPDIERRMRFAQLTDSLEALRQILKIKSRMIQFKNKNLRGQRDGTRSMAVIDRVHERARAAAAKYRAARIAHLELAGVGDWERTYRVLNDADIRGFQDAARLRPRKGRLGTLEDDQVGVPQQVEEEPDLVLFNEVRTQRDGTGETRRVASWIWTVDNSEGPEDHQDDVYRSEWAKTRARTHRAKEEVMLLKEEMRRTLAFLEHKAKWWRGRPILQHLGSMPKDIAEGLSAYASSQAELQERMAVHFRDMWKAPLDPKNEDDLGNMEGDDEDEGNEDDEDDGSGGDDENDDEGCEEGNRHTVSDGDDDEDA